MPIIIAARPAAPTTPVPAPPPWLDEGRTRLTWWAPDGTEVPLSRPSLGWRLLRGVVGLGGPAVEITAEAVDGGGEQVLHQWTGHRLITLPLRIGGSTRQQFVDRFDQLADWFGQTDVLGPGRLEVARPDGRRREILAYLQSAFDDEAHGTSHLAATVPITLYCPDPWWRDVNPITLVQSNLGGRRFLGTLAGARYPALSPGKTLGDTTVVNPGRVPAYPDWLLAGPWSTFTATSHRLGGALFSLTPPVPLVAGQSVRIVTEPLDMQVIGPAGEDWTEHLSWPGAELWPLMPGSNRVTFSAVNGGPETALTLTFKPRHRSA